ncbi:MAG: tetratricopeptide repeat protein [Pirellulales bacterium]|nr:tetratricopeptide repeat protein [Pirellulales bacterium]
MLHSARRQPVLKGVRRLRLRGIVFRLAAVVLGLAPFIVAEAVFAVLDWGRPAYDEDPFVGFSAAQPLFVLSDDGTRYEIPRSRQVFFRPESFAAQKADDEFRIFCLGGSTVQGRPFAVETSFTTWLEIDLEAADPKRRWEVVNCGGVSYASYRLVPILEEVLGFDPDLIILYTGHNEFLEDRTYAHIKHLPRVVAGPCELASQTRTYTLLRRAYVQLLGVSDAGAEDGRPILGPETEAMLEYRGGLDQYERDDKWRRDVIEHFCYNLDRMVQIAHDAGVPVLLVNPVCNLRDCAPFKAQHRDHLTDDQLRRWESLVSRAGEVQRTDLRRAVRLLQEAAAIDDQHAGAHYRLAKCYDALGMLDQARESYLQAKELDVCPLRILEPMNQAVLETADRTATPVLDVRKIFEDLSQGGIPGGYLLVDHVHPSIAGHRRIADALTDELTARGIVDPVPGWEKTRDQKAEEHLGSLSDLYFAQGQERLESLRGWTQGKADWERPRGRATGKPP